MVANCAETPKKRRRLGPEDLGAFHFSCPTAIDPYSITIEGRPQFGPWNDSLRIHLSADRTDISHTYANGLSLMNNVDHVTLSLACPTPDCRKIPVLNLGLTRKIKCEMKIEK